MGLTAIYRYFPFGVFTLPALGMKIAYFYLKIGKNSGTQELMDSGRNNRISVLGRQEVFDRPNE